MHWERAEKAKDILEDGEYVVVWLARGKEGFFLDGYFEVDTLKTDGHGLSDWEITHFMVVDEPEEENV